MDGWIDGCIPLLLSLLLLLLLLQGPKEYTQYDELSTDYSSGHIHPGDLKTAVTEALNRILEPVRSHFASGEPKILLEKIKKFKVTR